MEASNLKKRRHTRFFSDPNTLVRMTPLATGGEVVGLAIDESYRGCSVVVRTAPAFVTGAAFQVKVGLLDGVEGTVVWTRELEPGILRVSFSLVVDGQD